MPDSTTDEMRLFYGSRFGADFLGEETVTGWTQGSDWNGWAVPHFEFREAQRLVQLHQRTYGPESAWYDADDDEFAFILDGDDVPETFPASEIVAEGKTLKVYPIGAGCWIWEEVEQDE